MYRCKDYCVNMARRRKQATPRDAQKYFWHSYRLAPLLFDDDVVCPVCNGYTGRRP